jgi:5-methyltetrahydrofolate corrinoid/iron sulfur protein methyltransferase
MILIGENLNIMSKTLGPAMRERNVLPVVQMAKAETMAGVDYLDINIGPARRDGEALMDWVVENVRTVTDLPLSLDTTNTLALEAGLKANKGESLINSISLQPERLEKGLPLVKRFSAEMIGLLWGIEGMPRDANERCMLVVDLVYQANQAGIANERIWIDPIVTPVSGEIAQLRACVEFLGMLKDIVPGCKSVVGLSNVSNGTPPQLRPYLNRTFMVMLERQGLYGAIVDAFDSELIKIARGQAPGIVSLIHRSLDGEKIDIGPLSPEEAKYVKTVGVLTGESLYSHSWLEL